MENNKEILTSACISLNLSMKACFPQSTNISENRTMRASGNNTHRYSEIHS